MSWPAGIKVTEHLDPTQDITAEWASLQRRLREDVQRSLESHLLAQDHLLQQLVQRQYGLPRLGRRAYSPVSKPWNHPDITLGSDSGKGFAPPVDKRPVSSWRAQDPDVDVEAEAAAWLDETLGAGDIVIENFAPPQEPQEAEPAAEEPPKEKEKEKEEPKKKLTNAELRSIARQTQGSASVGDEMRLHLEAHLTDHKLSLKNLHIAEAPAQMRIKCIHGFFAVMDWWLNLREPERTNCLARIVKSNYFEALSFSMVVLNTMFIIMSKNWSLKNLSEDGDNEEWMKYEVAFAVYFVGELLLRIAVHRLHFFANEDMGWNHLDFIIVGFSAWGTSNNLMGQSGVQMSFLRTVRVLKLARVLRMLRMIRVFTALRVMIVAILDSALVLFWCVVLLLFMLLIFALLFVQYVEDFLKDNCASMAECPHEELLETFGSVEAAMLSLYMAITGGNDWAYYYHILSVAGVAPGLFMIFFTIFYYFGVFNVITGIFVDKALKAAAPDNDLQLVDMRHKEKEYIQGFEAVLYEFDHNSNGVMEHEEFLNLIESEGGRFYLKMLGIEPNHTEVVFDGLHKIHDQVPVADFVRGCMRMKGSANNLDLHEVHYEVSQMAKVVGSIMSTVNELKEDMAKSKLAPGSSRMPEPAMGSKTPRMPSPAMGSKAPGPPTIATPSSR